MTAPRRWALVALGVALLVGVPLAWRALPAPEDDVGARVLLERVRVSAGETSWSGYVETDGQVQFPSVQDFDDVAALLGDRNRLRVWWRDDDAWRVDRLLTAGETGLVHRGNTTTEWSFERARAEIAEDPPIRLPRSVDLLPPVLGERALRAAGPADVERLPARRIAGRSAPGLRVRPGSQRSAVDRVDLWVDGETGVPLRVEVHADPGDFPELTTAFRDFSVGDPDSGVLDFEATATTEVVRDDVLDIADAANQYAPLRPPAEVAGLERTAASDGAVGVYGSGLAQLVAIPLRSKEADALRDQVGVTPGSERVPDPPGGLTVALAPLGLLVTGREGEAAWLVAGTVTRSTLADAARDLLRDTVVLQERE